MTKKYRKFESDYEIQRRIMDRRQNYSESAENFISEIILLKNQMRNSIPEKELVMMVKDNLKDGLSQLIYPINILDMDQLLCECKRAERNLAKRNHFRQNQNQFRKVNELDFSLETNSESNNNILPTLTPKMDDYQVEALKFNTPQVKQLLCWNCKRAGHTFIECHSTQRNLFCYRCGYDGVITPRCPTCLGNQQNSMMSTGPSCSDPKQSQLILKSITLIKMRKIKKLLFRMKLD